MVKKRAKKVSKVIRTNFNEKLFNKLKETRDTIAKEKNVAGFIILNDNVLKELAYYYPTDKELFLMIKGVGESKFKKYGKNFLNIIKEFLSENSCKLEEKQKELRISILPAKPKINIKERTEARKLRVKELIEQKISIEDMAIDLNLTEITIANYIGRLLKEDNNLDTQYIKNSIEGYSDIVKAFKKHGIEKIGPIYNELGGNVEYGDISLVKVLLLSK